MIPEIVVDDPVTLLTEIQNLSPETFKEVAEYIKAAYLDALPAGEIIAVGVSLEDYMAHYAADHCEWVEGYVIKMSPSEIHHSDLIKYLTHLLDTYLELNPIGRLVLQPFAMRLPAFPRRRREPDLFVVLKTNLAELKNTYMDGPADICIEIISEESIERDTEDKFEEYEKGGVPEYWIIDPLQNEARFYRLDETGHYVRHVEDTLGNYVTPALPKLMINVPEFWQDELNGPIAIVEAIKAMLRADME